MLINKIESNATIISGYQKSDQGQWRDGIYRVQGLWENNVLRFTCQTVRDCQTKETADNLRQQKIAKAEQQAGTLPYLTRPLHWEPYS